MSRPQQNQVFNQTSGESGTAFTDAENAYKTAGTDIGDFQSQLSALNAENPYNVGGQYQQQQTQALANTSDAMARAAAVQLQGQAARTGQNPGAANATAEAIEQQNERTLSGQEAEANTERISQGAGYNTKVAQMYGEVPGMEEGIAKGEGELYGTSVNAEEAAAKQPSFMDQMGDAFAQGIGSGAAKLLV